MKKLTIIAILSLMASLSAHAQLSIDAGFNTFNLKAPSRSVRLNGFSIQGEYLFQYAGSRYDKVGIAPGIAFEYNMSKAGGSRFIEQYIDVPIYNEVVINFASNFGMLAELGPVFSYGLYSKREAGDGIVIDHYKNDTYYQYKKFDIMLSGKIGVILANHLRLFLSYDRGLLDRGMIFDVTNGTTKRYKFTIGAGFTF